jgi:hypothetical protein
VGQDDVLWLESDPTVTPQEFDIVESRLNPNHLVGSDDKFVALFKTDSFNATKQKDVFRLRRFFFRLNFNDLRPLLRLTRKSGV